ncbi:integrase family protein [Janthinobacterium sp. 75]|uniref:tyrosine-type recombinase/integrase n=1 Tax=Janthinobacterium sp. 75 TaxID=2135628 RepID=UPI001062B8B8|nr:integrase family protein [Janthinobacterium sp. 75]TDY32927.1 phage integrase family protein [Janthinobacterium sp. 75]
MAKVNFTADRVAAFQCEVGKQQSIMWDAKTPGLGLRVTAAGARSYIFETRLEGKTIRITIGDIRTWTVGKAQAEATRHKAQTDQGIDPRLVRAEQHAAQVAVKVETAAAALRDSVTLGAVWPVYVAERTPHWGEHQISAHRKIIQAGGEGRKRSPKPTKAGPLSDLAAERLVDLSDARIEAWAKVEAQTRPSSARLAMRLLKAFLNWCAAHPHYSAIVTRNAAKSAKAREILGKPKVKHDLLQREQLAAWFNGVRKIGNPVIAAYLQTLLLIGARREEVAGLRWADVDFQWGSMKLGDKVEDFRMVPLTPYVAHLLGALPRRNEWVFSSTSAESGKLAEPRIAHNEAVAAAGLPHLTLHGLRRSFATLSEWTETPAGIAAQIQGHAPQGVREQNYIRRPLDLLRKWHVKIEEWMLEQAAIQFQPAPAELRVVSAA